MHYIRHLLACTAVTDVSYHIRKETPELGPQGICSGFCIMRDF